MGAAERERIMPMHDLIGIVCGHVFRDERPISVVIHHSDDTWQFVCGGHDHPDDCSDFEAVGIAHLIDRQSNIREAAELSRGWMAERTPAGWTFLAHDD